MTPSWLRANRCLFVFRGSFTHSFYFLASVTYGQPTAGVSSYDQSSGCLGLWLVYGNGYWDGWGSPWDWNGVKGWRQEVLNDKRGLFIYKTLKFIKDIVSYRYNRYFRMSISLWKILDSILPFIFPQHHVVLFSFILSFDWHNSRKTMLYMISPNDTF